jgi:hypothetical protein
VEGGIPWIAAKLASSCHRVHLNTSVNAITPSDGIVPTLSPPAHIAAVTPVVVGKPTIEYVTDGADVTTATFDHVIIATQSNQAARFIQPMGNEDVRGLKQALASFNYEKRCMCVCVCVFVGGA